MRMRQVVGGVWGVLIQEVGVGKWAFLAISGLGELEKLKHCHILRHLRQNLTNLTTAAQHKALAFQLARENRPTPAEFRTGAHRACNPRIRGATAASTSR